MRFLVTTALRVDGTHTEIPQLSPVFHLIPNKGVHFPTYYPGYPDSSLVLEGMSKPGIIRHSSSSKTSSADNLISLYSKIPDYAEVKHLGQSDFIRALEQLKEEFRRVRSSLYSSNSNEDEDDDIDGNGTCVGSQLKVLNIRDSASLSALNPPTVNTANRNAYDQCNDKFHLKVHGHQSQLHRSPTTSNYAINSLNYNKPSRSLSFHLDQKCTKNCSSEDENSIHRVGEGRHGESTPSSDSADESTLDLGGYVYREFKEYEPPGNVEKRLLERRAHNNSSPSLSTNAKSCLGQEDENQHLFKAHPVPSHVYKPLYEFIMLKNQRRSQKVREQSKQKLMAQVKPFTFSNKSSLATTFPHYPQHKSLTNCERAMAQTHTASSTHNELLNNAKPIKSSRRCASHHTSNFRMVNHFKANPAPPRSKALLSAMRLKEQQEYRELKKRLRAEALLKNATLPPAMAARDKRTKLSNAKLDTLILEYQNSYNNSRDKNNKNRDREQSTDLDADEDNTFTDEDRLSEDSFRYLDATPNINSAGTSADAVRKQRNFTSYGKSRHSSAASGIFECTSNDNLASRLRIQETRRKEAVRIKREEEELLKLMRNDCRRKKLRDSHLSAWRRAHSYSSKQDIAMRRQLRAAASILERESFVKDMSSMLSRVRSAPLLLEGVRERRYEPCKKHKEEFLNMTDRSLSNNNKQVTTPRYMSIKKTGNRSSNWLLDRYGFGDDDPSRSETVALAEGSLTNSENSDYEDVEDGVYNKNGGAEGEDKDNGADDKSGTTTPRSRNQKKQVRVSLFIDESETQRHGSEQKTDT